MTKLPRITTGIQRLDDALSKWAFAIEDACNLTVQAPMTLKPGPTGPVIGYAPPLRKKLKITATTGTTGKYTAAEVYESSGGAWTLLPSGWSGDVWEYNLFSGVAIPSYVVAEWCGPTSDFRFQLGGCS